jgi:hypothetical protein
MFVTHCQFEQAFPSGLAAQGSRYWRAVELSLRMPWMVLTIREDAAERAFERTLLLSHGADLSGLLRTHRAESFAGLDLLTYAAMSGDGSGWKSRAVRRVWKDEGAGDDQPGMFIYEDEIGRMLDEFGTMAAGSMSTWTLLLELPEMRHA